MRMMMVIVKVSLIGHLLRPVDELFLLGGLFENFNIRHHHDATRDPEADGARNQRVGNIDDKLALVGKSQPVGDGLVGRVEARKDGYAADEDRAQPDGPDHNVHPFGGNLHRVIEGFYNRIVTIIADAT